MNGGRGSVQTAGTARVASVCALLAAATVSAQQSDLDRMLDMSLEELSQVRVVTVLKTPQPLAEVPATVRVITAQQIRKRAYFTLEDALADLPGVQFRNIVGFNSYVFLRGIPSQNNKILVLVDGVPVNELNSGGFYGGAQFNLAAVERIEVLYGPASALYGTNAVSGIVNIVTRNPATAEGGEMTLTAGRFSTTGADVVYGHRSGDGRRGFTVSAMAKSSDKADIGGRAGDNNWSTSLDTFEDDRSFDARLHLGGLDAGLLVQDKNASYATRQVTYGTPYRDNGVNWHIRFANAWTAYRLEGTRWSLRTTGYLRDTTVLDDTIPIIENPTATSAGRQFRYYRPGRLVGDETLLHWDPNPRWRVLTGLTLERESLSSTFSITESDSATERPRRPPEPPRLHNTLASIFAQTRLAVSASLAVYAGLRHDSSSYYGTVDTPRLGLVYTGRGVMLKALYGEAFRAPRPWDYTDGAGNPLLRPETMRSWELAGAWSPSPPVRLELSVFRNRLEDLLTRVFADDTWRWVNAGEVRTDGVEALVEVRRGAVAGHLGYAFTDSVDDNGAPIAEIARHSANLGLSCPLAPALTGDLRIRFIGRRTNPKPIPTTGNTVIHSAVVADATLTWQLRHGFFLQAIATNVTDAEYYHPSNLPPSRYRQPQRAFRVKVGYAF